MVSLAPDYTCIKSMSIVFFQDSDIIYTKNGIALRSELTRIVEQVDLRVRII